MGWKDPMAEAIAKKQLTAHRRMYSEADLDHDEYYRKIAEERKKFKTLILVLLKEDEEFRKEVVKLLKH